MLTTITAGDLTCAQHITEALRGDDTLTEQEACRFIARRYESCRVSSPECNPDVCDGGIHALKQDDGRTGKPWAWAVLCINFVVAIAILVAYKFW